MTIILGIHWLDQSCLSFQALLVQRGRAPQFAILLFGGSLCWFAKYFSSFGSFFMASYILDAQLKSWRGAGKPKSLAIAVCTSIITHMWKSPAQGVSPPA